MVFGKILNLLWQLIMVLGNFFTLVNGQMRYKEFYYHITLLVNLALCNRRSFFEVGPLSPLR